MAQSLILAVSGQRAAQFGARGRKAFENKGGSIGRSEDCDWVLAASGVSRVHAMIQYVNGMYFIEDRSTNGMLLNGAPLTKGDPSALSDGDRLSIDNFEVECHLEAAGATAALATAAPEAAPPTARPTVRPPPVVPQDDAFDLAAFGFDAPAPSTASAASDRRISPSLDLDDDLLGGLHHGDSSSDRDPLSFLGGLHEPPTQGFRNTPSTGTSKDWNHSSAPTDHFRPPSAMSPGAERRATTTLPENWDLTTSAFAAMKAPPPAAATPVTRGAPPTRSPPTAAPTTMPAAPPPSNLPPDADQIFKTVVDGVMDVLRARAEIKNTFRLQVTIIQRAENNPLKFAPTAEDALQKILAPPSAAFLSGTAAFQDAFDDISCHQMAMLAGMRAAFDSTLAYFKPERYEQEVDGGGGRRMGIRDLAGGKGRYWERYKENFEALEKNPDERFRRLFGEEFARAYEEQLGRLKSARRKQQAR